MQQMVYTIRLDLRDTGIVNTSLRLKQGDSGIKIVVNVFNGGVAVFDSSTTPKIVFRRPDGAAVMADMTVESSSYSYTLVGNELQVPGKELIDVKFPLGDTGRESTLSCSIEVVPDTITPNTHGSDIYDNDLAELVAEATAAAETVEEVVGDSEAWAVGERNGVPVGPEDPAYHNNSKWWSEQANVTSLAALTDVDLDALENGDLLQLDGQTGKWKNSSDVWKTMARNGAYNLYNHNLQTQVVSTGGGNSVTVTVNRTVGSADYGTFSIVGTIGSATDIVVGALDPNVFKAGQKYKLTGCPNGGGANTYNIRVTGAGVEDHGDGVEFTATGSDQMKIQLRGATINATFKPMITTNLNATYNDYQPYTMTNRELTEDTIVKEFNASSLSSANARISLESTDNIIIRKIGRLVIIEKLGIVISAGADILYNAGALITGLPAPESAKCVLVATGNTHTGFKSVGFTVNASGSLIPASFNNIPANANNQSAYFIGGASYIAKE